mmetsp:Transcript_37583/g.70154  ORF Transcript_37583/g.70154 Transcript_37583/m.70154 type:complete len:258 (+) Transcript_37583:331-1104(+)
MVHLLWCSSRQDDGAITLDFHGAASVSLNGIDGVTPRAQHSRDMLYADLKSARRRQERSLDQIACPVIAHELELLLIWEFHSSLPHLLHNQFFRTLSHLLGGASDQCVRTTVVALHANLTAGNLVQLLYHLATLANDSAHHDVGNTHRLGARLLKQHQQAWTRWSAMRHWHRWRCWNWHDGAWRAIIPLRSSRGSGLLEGSRSCTTSSSTSSSSVSVPTSAPTSARTSARAVPLDLGPPIRRTFRTFTSSLFFTFRP